MKRSEVAKRLAERLRKDAPEEEWWAAVMSYVDELVREGQSYEAFMVLCGATSISGEHPEWMKESIAEMFRPAACVKCFIPSRSSS